MMAKRVRVAAFGLMFLEVVGVGASGLGQARFAPVALRGYGTVSGVERVVGDGSVLEITCQDGAKARLVQAKYLSDLVLLPGVTKGAGTPVIYSVEGQGAVAAYLAGNKVTIVAAGSEAGLRGLIETVKPVGVTTAQMDVPMYLDRWDKFNFRHYYRPLTRQPGTTDATYDYTAEFDWAAKEDRAGFLLNDSPLATDSAQGMLNEGWANYVRDEARKRLLPVELHVSANAGGEPTWLLNTYREQTQMKMPGFTGNFHELMLPNLGGQGVLSWSATTGEDAILGLLQKSIRDVAGDPNLISFLEPHGELHHGPQDIFLEYGPVVDVAYRKFLKGKYGTVEAVAKRWGVGLKSWDDVHFQEVASFAGWGPEALDIGATWRVGYEKLLEVPEGPGHYESGKAYKSEMAPESWFAAGFDDSKWPVVPGGGNDQELFLMKEPAVFRHTFDLPAGWKEKNKRTWLYVWDMNEADHQPVRVVLNGKEVSHTSGARTAPHWVGVEVTDVLEKGANTLAIRVPQGYIAYKVYLSPVEVKQYPNLGEGLNAQWVDFSDFTQRSRIDTVRRGMEMIRQVEPDMGITLMHPDEYSDGVKGLAEAYGGEFHNTGYMGGIWADYNTALMRGANLPYSLEPGGPARDFMDWKKQMGLYQTEGVQAVDYFIHIGDILWRPEIKADYEAHRKQFALMGQSHYQKAQIAVLYSDRGAQLMGYPWGSAPNTNMPGGYWAWNAASLLHDHYPSDGLSQSSFANGDANAYEVIIDSNTSIMDDAMVDSIEAWVRNGGTFITLGQTGRHRPERPDTWPISRLTGYSVEKIDKMTDAGGVLETGTLQAAPGQELYDSSWNGVKANGLHMKKQAGDVQDLLLWKDGTVAAGMRPLGKGYVVDLGAKFVGSKMADRFDPGGDSPEARQMRKMLMALLAWRKMTPEPGVLKQDADWVKLRHGVTNNGLYDVWTVWNQSPDKDETVSVKILGGQKPGFAIDMVGAVRMPLTAPEIDNVALKPYEAKAFLTPKGAIGDAAGAWFDLQRKWWRGTTKPEAKVLPGPDHRFSEDLSEGWRFKVLPADADATSLLKEQVEDGSWPTRTLGLWDVKDAGGGHGVLRRSFTVPSRFGNGLVSIWITSWQGGNGGFFEEGRVWLDGKEVKPMSAKNYIAIGLPELKAGSTHEVAMEIKSRGVLAGLSGEAWLSYEPKPPAEVDLAGKWATSPDGLTYGSPAGLPGKFSSTWFLRRSFYVDGKYRGQNAVLTVDGDPELVSVLINGRLVRKHHHMIGARWSLNLTPFVKFGAENEVQLVRWDGVGSGVVREVHMGFYDPKFYP
jgi:hypothetical protein